MDKPDQNKSNNLAKFKKAFGLNKRPVKEKGNVRQAARKALIEYCKNSYPMRFSDHKWECVEDVIFEVTEKTGEEKQDRQTREETRNTYEVLLENWKIGRGHYKLAVATIYFLYMHTGTDAYEKIMSPILFDGQNTLFGFTGVDNGFNNNKSNSNPQPSFLIKPEYRSKQHSEDDDEISLSAWDMHSVTLVGREKEIETLEAFIEDDKSFSICAVIAPSGAGKTRLVSEWMHQYVENEDWHAGFVDDRRADHWEEWTPTANTLIVIDYTYNFDAVIGALIRGKDRYSPFMVRLIVIDHVLPAILDIQTRGYGEDVSSRSGLNSSLLIDAVKKNHLFKEHPIELKPFSEDNTIPLAIIANAADLPKDNPKVAEGLIRLRAMGDAAQYPLFAILVGQAIRQGRAIESVNRADLVYHYLSRTNRIPWENSSEEEKPEQKILGIWAGILVAVATIRRGVDFDLLWRLLPRTEALGTIGLTGEHEKVLKSRCWRIVSDKDNKRLKQFEPDILGESFFLLLYQELLDREPNAAGPLRDSFQKMVCYAENEEQDQKLANEFVGFFIRLTRNLMIDHKEVPRSQLEDTYFNPRKCWETLCTFLDPRRFQQNSVARHAVADARINMIWVRLVVEPKLDLQEQISCLNLDDFIGESRSQFSAPQVLPLIRYHEVLFFSSHFNHGVSERIVNTLCAIDQKMKVGWPSLVLAAYFGYQNILQILIDSEQCDINQGTTDNGSTALMVACQNGHVACVEKLLARDDIAVNQGTTDSSATALILACQNGHVECVEKLLAADGIEVNQGTTDNGATALILACQNGHVDCVEKLLAADGIAVNQGTTDDGATALILACQNGHVDCVEKLLAADGIAVNQGKTNDGATALMFACNNGHFECVERLLVHHNITVNQGKTNDGFTALILACYNGHVACVERLLAADGIEVNQGTTDNGFTALMVACQNGHFECVERLLVHDDITVNQGKTNDGATALMLACKNGHFECVERLLVHDDITVNQGKTNDGATALMLACKNGHVECVKRLLVHDDITVNQGTTDDGFTALMVACKNGHVACVERLLAQADITVNQGKTDNGFTALMVACQNGHVACVERLLAKAGIAVNQGKTDNGFTALMVACWSRHVACVERLLAADSIAVNQGTTDDGTTALMLACQDGHFACVERLLVHDDITVNQGKTNDGASALMLACQDGHFACVERLLVADGIAVNQGKTDNGVTALMVACYNGHFECVERLLAADGIAVNQGTADDGTNALMLACHNGHFACVEKLLAHHNITVNQGKTNDGTTALMVACQNGHADCVEKLLVADGIAVNQGRTDNGFTALMVACWNGHVECVESLLSDNRIVVVQELLGGGGATALTFACANKRFDCVERLLVKRGEELRSSNA